MANVRADRFSTGWTSQNHARTVSRIPTFFALQRESEKNRGLGDGRFDSSPFGGVSVTLDETLTLVAEYDGFNANAGLAISGLDPGGEEDWVVLGYFGYSDLDRPVVGFSITKH